MERYNLCLELDIFWNGQGRFWAGAKVWGCEGAAKAKSEEVQISLKAMEMQKFIWNEILAALGISCSRKNRVSLCALDALTLLVFVNSVCPGGVTQGREIQYEIRKVDAAIDNRGGWRCSGFDDGFLAV
ncbi:hypothetical protein U1Q18_020037 [Sarracenia purpurea var. burkii]